MSEKKYKLHNIPYKQGINMFKSIDKCRFSTPRESNSLLGLNSKTAQWVRYEIFVQGNEETKGNDFSKIS